MNDDKLVHSYDTDARGNRCGVPGQTSSTKHAAGVTCPECRRILGGDREAHAPEELDAAAVPAGGGVS